MTRDTGRTAVSILIALTATAVLLALFWFGAYQPISTWSETMAEDLADGHKRLIKLQRVAQLHASNPQQKSADREADFRPDFLKGDPDAIVLADIQTRLRAIIVGKNCELISASALPPREIGGANMVGLKLQMRGQLADVHQVMHTIEFGLPLLFIERADLRVDEHRGAVQDNPDHAVPNLYADIDVYGAKWPFSERPVTVGPGVQASP